MNSTRTPRTWGRARLLAFTLPVFAATAALAQQTPAPGTTEETTKVKLETFTVVGSRRHGDNRRLELEVGLARHRCEIDVPADTDVTKNGHVAVKPTDWRLFPAKPA